MADIDSLKEEYRSNLTQCIQRVKTELDNKASADDLTELQTQVDIIKTNDNTITGSINEINGNLLDTVGFSADYKNIILNRKNGLNPYIIPISSIINNASLTELKDVDSTDMGNGKTLVYDSAIQKHKYVDSELTDELVKMEASSDSEYLADLIDKNTIVNDKGVLKVKKLDGQEVTIAEINYLKGLTMNIVDLVKSFSNGGVKMYEHTIATYADLLALDRSEFVDGIRYFVYVLADETHGGIKTTYICDKTNTSYFGVAGDDRDFTTEPIDLANEVTGKLGVSNIDVDALWKLLTVYDTYKTLTTKNEPFGTHGANAMYNELVAEIGKKSNTSDLTTHTSDTNIHITSAERTKWNEVDNKVDKTDIADNLTSTDIDKPLSAKQGKVLDDKKLNKSDVDKIAIINADNVNIKDFILEKCTDENKVYYITAMSNCTDLPKASANYIIVVQKIGSFTTKVTAKELVGNNNEYVCTYRSDNIKWTSWQKLCTTSVADVEKTDITSKVSNATVNYGNGVSYSVKNGICYVQFTSVTVGTSSNGQYIVTKGTLPHLDNSLSNGRYPVVGGGSKSGMVVVDGNTGGIRYFGGDITIFTTISYPVAEQ